MNALNSFSFFLFLNKELKWSGFLKTTAKTKPSQVEYAYNDVGGGGGRGGEGAAERDEIG